jgi:hypothetical protein
MVSMHGVEQEHEKFMRILLICACERVVYFPDCGDEVCGSKGLGGVGTDGGVHAGEDCVDGAVDAVLTGAEVGVVGVGEVMVSDDGVVDEGLED